MMRRRDPFSRVLLEGNSSFTGQSINSQDRDLHTRDENLLTGHQDDPMDPEFIETCCGSPLSVLKKLWSVGIHFNLVI